MSLQLSQQWCASKAQISTQMGDDTVILDTKAGKYFSLNGVGGALWHELHQPVEGNKLLQTVIDTYDVKAQDAERDLVQLLGTLEAQGLIECQSL